MWYGYRAMSPTDTITVASSLQDLPSVSNRVQGRNSRFLPSHCATTGVSPTDLCGLALRLFAFLANAQKIRFSV